MLSPTAIIGLEKIGYLVISVPHIAAGDSYFTSTGEPISSLDKVPGNWE
jgi:hypothetical protein